MKKRNNWRTTALCGLLALVCLLSACGGAPKLTYQNGAYQNASSGMAFCQASANYRAAGYQTGSILAKISGIGSEDIPLYAIDQMDSSLYLSDGSYNLYYRQDLTLPTLSEMEVDRIMLAISGAHTMEVGSMEDRAQIARILELYESGAAIPRERVIPMPQVNYQMLFSSKAYPGILYALEYWSFAADVEVFAKLTESGEIPDLYPGIPATLRDGQAVFNLGKNLIFDRTAGKFYAAGDLLNGFFSEA